ncbi:TetR/AcrR family transcriptional regulator [Nocardia sp. NPDC088792]|uniref:TetR/AcrR family transcriptional regulator n=1 Tax=Nocardia sp. NPDC088792 TaxID=3364332 RepID=UPI00380E4281
MSGGDATAPRGRYAGLTADERRLRRREQLRTAALDTIADEGISGLKVRALCARAGLNDRYFYESYPDTDRLLIDVVEDQLAQAMSEIMAAITTAPADTRLRVRAVIETGLAAIVDHPARRRMVTELQSLAELRSRRAELVTLLSGIMLDQGRELLGESATGMYAELAARTVVHGGLELLAEWVRGDLRITRSQLVDFLVAMILTASDITTTVEREVAG